MVFQKRLNYGFNGYQVPPVPRAARSLRRGGPFKKKAVDNELCAFDLLATVAGKILLEGQSNLTLSSDGIVKEEQHHDDGKLLNVDSGDQSSSEIGLVAVEHGSPLHNHLGAEITNSRSCFSSGSASVISNSGCLDKIGSDAIKASVEGIASDTCSSGDPNFVDQKPAGLTNLGIDVKSYIQENHYECGFPPQCKGSVKIATKDDDENYSRCTKKSKVMRTIRSVARVTDRRRRRFLASRNWRAPKRAKDGGFSDAGAESYTVYHTRHYGFKRHGSQRVYPYKKRKFFYSLQSASNGETGRDNKGIYEASRKDMDMPAPDLGGASSGAGHGNSFTPRESHLKLRIKSFRVPELFIELPVTATVGSLKKTVMDAITTLLEGGLHIGVLVQGRKIRDDDRTLLESGISHDNMVDTLGFMLEPKPAQVYTPMRLEEPSIDPTKPLSRLGPVACIRPNASADSQENSWASFTESECKFAASPVDVLVEEGTADSKALVVAPEVENVQALAVVTPPQKPKRCEAGQRRIRRPFSVAEVEALVHAVENLGTGRWRDVKLRAFASAKHRTYVDLKDKWKTLVHTATISPQQRRGEPVPQELLDRVLGAHAYWTHQQAKQQLDSV